MGAVEREGEAKEEGVAGVEVEGGWVVAAEGWGAAED